MKNLLVVVAMVLACSAAQAVDMEEYSFMDGLISFKAPAGWVVDHDDAMTGVVVAPRRDSTAMVVFSTPNPHYDGDVADYLGTQLGVFFAAIAGGDGEVTDEEETSIDGRDAIVAHFAATIGGDDVTGFSVAFDVQDYVVMVTAFAPAKDKKFLRSVEEILGSYEIDEDRLDEWEEALDEIGMHIADQLGALLGE